MGKGIEYLQKRQILLYAALRSYVVPYVQVASSLGEPASRLSLGDGAAVLDVAGNGPLLDALWWV